MKIQQLDEVDGRRTFVVVCDQGDDPVEALTASAKRFDLFRHLECRVGLGRSGGHEFSVNAGNLYSRP